MIPIYRIKVSKSIYKGSLWKKFELEPKFEMLLKD